MGLSVLPAPPFHDILLSMPPSSVCGHPSYVSVAIREKESQDAHQSAKTQTSISALQVCSETMTAGVWGGNKDVCLSRVWVSWSL